MPQAAGRSLRWRALAEGEGDLGGSGRESRMGGDLGPEPRVRGSVGKGPWFRAAPPGPPFPSRAGGFPAPRLLPWASQH